MHKLLPIHLRKLLLVSSCSLLTSPLIHLSDQPLLSQVLRGEYQNKIRRYSAPQKIFDVFATIRQDGQLYMTLHDLLKAICFYNFSVSDESKTNDYQPQAILKLLGKKDKFQIYDYFILVRLLAFQRKKIQAYFSLNNKTTMDKEQFRTFLREHVCQDYNQFIKPSAIGLQSRQFKPDIKKFQQSIDETVESVFKTFAKGINFSQLVEFRRKMIREVFGFEFLMFKHDQQRKIDGSDFARSIIKYVQSSKKGKYMSRIKQFSQQFSRTKISLPSYINFHFYIQTNMYLLIQQLNNHGALSKDNVFALMCKFSKDKIISQEQVHILVRVLDVDDSGFIQKDQFLGVLEQLQYYTQVKSGEQTFKDMIHQDFIKLKSKAKRILDIIQQ